eukprot:TRINITY_DN4868_c1_g1_i1.p1 TRINITY_DN4868_c1_g1~~TRINITY_DN4868_c1_g1_i1.p1  ORF type:complete len:351 (+),score=79.18 TRINITY_DN4868_c1_g1_i1:82-1134(+)
MPGGDQTTTTTSDKSPASPNRDSADENDAARVQPSTVLSPVEEHQLVMLLQSELAHSLAQKKKSQRMAHSDIFRMQQLQQTQARCRERTAEKMDRAAAKREAIIQQRNLHAAMTGSVTQAKQSNAITRLDEADQKLRERQEKAREISRQKQEETILKRQLLATERQHQLERSRAERQARAKVQADANEKHAKEEQQIRRERIEERFKRTAASREKITLLGKYREAMVAAEISRANELERQRIADQERQESEMKKKRADQIKVSHERKQLFDKVAHHLQKGTDPRRIAKMFSLKLPEPEVQQTKHRPRTPSSTVKRRPTPPPTPADQKDEILGRISTPTPGVRHWPKWVYD